MPSFQGCAIPKKNVPSLDYKTFLIKNARLVDVNLRSDCGKCLAACG